MNQLPLKGITVLEFSQYLSGPSAGLRLADMGARVIKIERPGSGDACRKLAIKNLWADDGSSLLFHTINRNKESYAADLKNPDHLKAIKELIKHADVITHNFRPGVMQKAGLDYESVKLINPTIIYGEITGYGTKGPWMKRPGQDLLLQSMSGLVYTTGNADDAPIPFGIAVADIICGAHLVQGILAGLLRRQKKGIGAFVEVSLLESLIDFQFELFTTYFTSNQSPVRSKTNNGHPLLSAPYGIYKTSDGFIAIAMVAIAKLADAIDCDALSIFTQAEAFSKRDEIKEIIVKHLFSNPSDHWISKLLADGIWSMEVLDWKQMKDHDAYKSLQMEQEVVTSGGGKFVTTRCPIRFNGVRLVSEVGAPELGQHNESINTLLDLGASTDLSDLVESLPGAQVGGSAQIEAGSNPINIVVVDLSQFLSGPSAGLRLADLGARVIKIEKPGTGDICRQLYVSDVMIEDQSTIFHAINRNKQSYSADLKNQTDLEKVKQIISKADVLLHNFRPGVMEKLGLSYDAVKSINKNIIYAEISGYGNEGPWKDLPGQDLLLQAASGLTWLSNNDGTDPTPMGVAVVDILAGAHIAQGILAALFQRSVTNEASLVQVSMFESILDFQFEVLTCFYNDGNHLPVRSSINNGHAYVSAPYGIYKTKDGYLALAMGSITFLADLLDCSSLEKYTDSAAWFTKRDEIKTLLAEHLKTQTNDHWLSILEPADIWCAKVMDYDALLKEEGYKILEMGLLVKTSKGLTVKTTRCPIKIDGKILTSEPGAPALGEHNSIIEKEFLKRSYVSTDH